MAMTIERSVALDGEPIVRDFECTRCGQVIPRQAMDKRRERKSNNTWCSDCNAGAKARIVYGDQVCVPWKGDIDLDTLQPVDAKGKPYLPGDRLCGHSDCVNRSHVQSLTPVKPVPGQTGILGGRVITYEQLISIAEEKKEDK